MSAPEPQSAVFHRPASASHVVQPNSPWTMVAGFGAVALVGLGVFLSLSHARQARAQSARPPAASAAPAPLLPITSSAPAAAPAPAPVLLAPAPVAEPASNLAAQAAAAQAAADEAQRLRAPAVVVDLGDAAPAQAPPARAAATVASAATGTAAASADPADARMSSDERFAARVAAGGIDTARATRIRDLSRTAPQGTVIAAVLETALNSDLPGSIRAVVSRDVTGFDGRQVLIPRGSKLIGQYKSGVAIGQTRAFVIWSRIITPSGISVEVGSPATDPLGRGGVAGETDNHFLQRFGAAILLSAITIGEQAALSHYSGGNTYVIASPTQANQVAAIALQKQIDIPPTIKVPQGAPVQVFVSRDLDFSGVVPPAP